jgi:hypothetical protein
MLNPFEKVGNEIVFVFSDFNVSKMSSNRGTVLHATAFLIPDTWVTWTDDSV